MSTPRLLYRCILIVLCLLSRGADAQSSTARRRTLDEFLVDLAPLGGLLSEGQAQTVRRLVEAQLQAELTALFPANGSSSATLSFVGLAGVSVVDGGLSEQATVRIGGGLIYFAPTSPLSSLPSQAQLDAVVETQVFPSASASESLLEALNEELDLQTLLSQVTLRTVPPVSTSTATTSSSATVPADDQDLPEPPRADPDALQGGPPVNSSAQEDISTGVLVGLILGSLGLGLALALLVVYLVSLRRRRKDRAKKDQKQSKQGTASSSSSATSSNPPIPLEVQVGEESDQEPSATSPSKTTGTDSQADLEFGTAFSVKDILSPANITHNVSRSKNTAKAQDPLDSANPAAESSATSPSWWSAWDPTAVLFQNSHKDKRQTIEGPPLGAYTDLEDDGSATTWTQPSLVPVPSLESFQKQHHTAQPSLRKDVLGTSRSALGGRRLGTIPWTTLEEPTVDKSRNCVLEPSCVSAQGLAESRQESFVSTDDEEYPSDAGWDPDDEDDDEDASTVDERQQKSSRHLLPAWGPAQVPHRDEQLLLNHSVRNQSYKLQRLRTPDKENHKNSSLGSRGRFSQEIDEEQSEDGEDPWTSSVITTL